MKIIFQVHRLVKKTRLTVFWDMKKAIIIDLLEKDTTVSHISYSLFWKQNSLSLSNDLYMYTYTHIYIYNTYIRYTFICYMNMPIYIYIYIYIYIRGSLNKFPDFFRMGTFIDSTHMKF